MVLWPFVEDNGHTITEAILIALVLELKLLEALASSMHGAKTSMSMDGMITKVTR